MAWASGASSNAGSHLLSKTLIDILSVNYTGSVGNGNFPDLNSTTAPIVLKAALYDNTVTPDSGATGASSSYGGGGAWVSTGGSGGTGHVFQSTGASATEWVQGGRIVTGSLSLTSANNASGSLITWAPSISLSNGVGFPATMTNIYGMFLYFNNTDGANGGVTNAGLGFWYFGGTNYGVTAGTLTVTSSASGLFTLQV